MEKKKYSKMLKDYFLGKQSPEGGKIFDKWFYQIDDTSIPSEMESEEKSQEIKERIKSKLDYTIRKASPELPHSRFNPQWAWYAAASVVLVSTLLLLFWADKSHFPDSISKASNREISDYLVYIEKVNSTNHKIVITLPDGSEVSLSPESLIRYPEHFSDKREILLLGEAFFQVVRDTTKTFIVTTGKVKTMVLGTSFNIRAYKHQSTIEVLVATGKVSVHNTAENTLVTLLPKQRAVFEERAAILRKDTLQITYDQQWNGKDGETIFSDLPLITAMELLHQRFGVRAVLDNNNLRNCKVNITLKDKTVSEIMEDICNQTGSICSLQQDQYVFSGKGCQAP